MTFQSELLNYLRKQFPYPATISDGTRARSPFFNAEVGDYDIECRNAPGAQAIMDAFRAGWDAHERTAARRNEQA
jgi:hypothetical protein